MPPITNPCFVCRGSSFQRQLTPLDSYSLLICDVCGQGRTVPFPSSENFQKLYSTDTYRANGKRFIKPMEWMIRYFRQKRLEKIRRYATQGTLLDIGCGGGQFLVFLRENGWQVAGIEVNEEMATYGRESLNLNIKTGDLQEAGFSENTFDVITLFHVLEHIQDPIVTLRECYRILKPGGLLVIAVPNFNSWQSRWTRKHWFHLDVPHHLHHFSAKTLQNFLEENSFRVGEVEHFSLEQNPFGFLQSLLNWSHMGHNALYDTLKTKRLRAKFSWKLIPTFALLPILLPISLFASILESLSRCGGTIEAYALKTIPKEKLT